MSRVASDHRGCGTSARPAVLLGALKLTTIAAWPRVTDLARPKWLRPWPLNRSEAFYEQCRVPVRRAASGGGPPLSDLFARDPMLTFGGASHNWPCGQKCAGLAWAVALGCRQAPACRTRQGRPCRLVVSPCRLASAHPRRAACGLVCPAPLRESAFGTGRISIERAGKPWRMGGRARRCRMIPDPRAVGPRRLGTVSCLTLPRNDLGKPRRCLQL